MEMNQHVPTNSHPAIRGVAPAGDGPLTLREIDTPAVVIDLDRVEANIAKLQGYLDAHGIRNRPHVKTHKLPFLAHLQLRAGAVGITVQTLGEAEVMAAAGIRDLLLTYNVIGEAKAVRLAAVARLVDSLAVAVDNEVALLTVLRAAELAERSIGLLVEFESGKRRQGVLTPAAALDLARRAHGDHLEFRGLLTYPCGPETEAFIREASTLFHEAGVALTSISAGGTPNMWRAHEVEGITEYRAGTSIYHDRRSVAQGSASFDECALHVHATVISSPEPGRAVIDAGSKVLTSEALPSSFGRGHGHVIELPDATVSELSEEHGVLDLSACPDLPKIGDRLRIVPNHVCPVSNLVDEVVLHRGGLVQALLPVAARGKR